MRQYSISIERKKRKEERGERKEERGKRKEERGKRKEERGERKEERPFRAWVGVAVFARVRPMGLIELVGKV
ncbi:MAG TPA: hypothetical protein VLZ54_08620 [Arenibacter sp.]|nr:hypothetical protein [Arenibacter sp.]